MVSILSNPFGQDLQVSKMNDFKTLYIDLIDGFKDKTNVIEQGTQKFNYNELSRRLFKRVFKLHNQS